MVGAVYSYIEGGVVVVEEGENVIVGHGEWLGYTITY